PGNGRSCHRRLRPRRPAVRATDGPAAVPGGERPGGPRAGQGAGAGAAPPAPTRDPARPGDHLFEVPPESPRPAVPDRPGPRRRPAPLPPGRAGVGPADRPPGALVAPGPALSRPGGRGRPGLVVPGTPGRARRQDRGPPGPADQVMRIGSLTAYHYRDKGKTSLGHIGTDSFSARVNDAVRLQAELSGPAYCYLIAFNPDGKEQLCLPGDENTPPDPVEHVSYPLGAEDAFGLTDGAGLQAFALLVSRQPLPCYREWRQRLGTVPWGAFAAEGVWRFQDGNYVSPRERGQVQSLEGLPKPLVNMCDLLHRRSGLDALQVLAFPVQP